MGSFLAPWLVGQSRLAVRWWLARPGRYRSSQWQIITPGCAAWTPPHLEPKGNDPTSIRQLKMTGAGPGRAAAGPVLVLRGAREL